MATIVTRAGKGSPLTFAEVDANFTNLNNDKLELSGGNAGATVVTATGSTTARTLANRFTDVVNVKDFGAVGDGVTDDTAAIQGALNWLGSVRGGRLIFPNGARCLITSQLIFKPTTTLPSPSANIHFSEKVGSSIVGYGDARLIAGASMTRMLLLQFNAATSSIGPFSTLIQDIQFDGQNLAGRAIECDFCMDVTLRKLRIRDTTESGVYWIGYGVARISECVISAPFCVNLREGGGDSVIFANDFFPSTRGVNFAKLAGNTVVRDNVFSGEGISGVVGVYLDGTEFLSTNEIRHVLIDRNEFSGMLVAVYGQKNSGGRNIYGVTVSNNHTTPAAGGLVHTGRLIQFIGVDDAIIANNYINSKSQSVTLSTDPAIFLSDCKRPLVYSNLFGNIYGPAIYLTSVADGKFFSNVFSDVGTASAGGVCVDVDTGTSGCVFQVNDLRQSSSSYAQNTFFERSGANLNRFYFNNITGASPPSAVGAASIVSGQVVASGTYAVSAGVASVGTGSTGFTVNWTATGTVTVTFASAQPNTRYIVKALADLPQVAVDTVAVGSFVVKTYNATGSLTDPTRVQIEVTN